MSEATTDLMVLEPIAPCLVESDSAVSVLAAAWQLDAHEIDVWAGVEAAITPEQPPAAQTVPELRQIIKEGLTMKERLYTVNLPAAPDPATASTASAFSAFYRRLAAMTPKTVDVKQMRPTPEALAAVPASVARAHFALPLSMDGRKLFVAFADPGDAAAIEAVSLASDCFVEPLQADRHALAVALTLAYAPRPGDIETAARRMGVPFIDLEKHKPEADAIAAVPPDVARTHYACPVKKDGNRLWVAFLDPRNIETVDAIRMASKCLVQPMLAEPDALMDAFVTAYGAPPQTREIAPQGERPPPAPPPVVVAAPTPESPDDTRRLLRETVAELREVRGELAALRLDVETMRLAALRADAERFRAPTVPRPDTARLFPFALPDRRIEP